MENAMKHIHRTRGDRVFDAINVAALCLLLAVILYPLIYVLSCSFSDPLLVVQSKITFLPLKPTLVAYQRVFRNELIMTGYQNTLFYTLLGTVLNVASSAGLLPGGPYMAGYYASKAYVVSMTRGVAEELREMHSPVYVCALCPGPVDTEFNDRADVVFALKGITPELCVEEAMRGMLRRKIIIVPSTLMRLATTAQKLVPTPLLMPILAHQQKKKLG